MGLFYFAIKRHFRSDCNWVRFIARREGKCKRFGLREEDFRKLKRLCVRYLSYLFTTIDTNCCMKKLSRRLSNTVLRDAVPCSLVDVYRWFGGMCCLHRQGILADCIASYLRTPYDVLPSCKVINRRHLHATLLYVPSKVSFCLNRDGAPITNWSVISRDVCLLIDLLQVRYSCLTTSSSSSQCWKCAKGSVVGEAISFRITHL